MKMIDGAIDVEKLIAGAEQFVISGVNYDSDEPFLVLDFPHSRPNERRLVRVLGEDFTLVRHAERFCSGRYDLDSMAFFPCPDATKVEAGRTQCFSCRQYTGFNPAFYHSPGAVSEKQTRYNNSPHWVYLAAFGSNIIKVGISHEQRLRKRWLEQGARVAVAVSHHKTAWGAREVEQRISESFRLPERLTGKQKIALLNEPINFNAVAERLLALKREIVHSFSIESVEAEANLLDGVYFLEGKLESTVLDCLGASMVAQLSGTCVGVVGKIIVSRQGQVTQCIPLFENHLCTMREAGTAPLAKTQLSLL